MLAEVPCDREDGEYLLFRYNADERKAEYIQKVTVEDRRTKFLLLTGGDYFVAERALTKSLNEIENEEIPEQDSVFEDDIVIGGTMEKEEGDPPSGNAPIVPLLLGGSVILILTGVWAYRGLKKKEKREQKELKEEDNEKAE